MFKIRKAINEREFLESRIKANKTELVKLQDEHFRAVQKKREADNAYLGYCYRTDEQSKKQAEQIKKNSLEITSRVDALSKKILELTKLIDADSDKLNSINIVATVQQLTQHQKDIKATQAKIKSIKTLIVEQEKIIDAAKNKIETTGSLRKQRAALLAESATGIDNAKKISEIDAEIAKADKNDQAENDHKATAAAKAADTKEGLLEMLEAHNKELADQQHTLIVMYDAVLYQMAMEEAAKYKAAAEQLAASVKAIMSIDKLIADAGIRSKSGVTSDRTTIIKIPAFINMEPTTGAGDYLDLYTYTTPSPDEVKKIVENLAEKGIEVISSGE